MIRHRSLLPSSAHGKTLAAGVAFLLSSASLSQAALMLTNITSGPVAAPASIDMANYGTKNWSVWDDRVTTGSGIASIAASASKTGGEGTISSISGLNNGSPSNVRGVALSSLTAYTSTFSWSDGTPGSVTSPGKPTGVLAANLDLLNVGVTLTISNLLPLTDGQYYQISLLTTGIRGTSAISATSGATTVNQPGFVFLEAKSTQVHQFAYNPNLQADTLTLTNLLSADTGMNSHVVIQAVGISIVPEPSVGLLCLAAIPLFRVRRRPRQA